MVFAPQQAEYFLDAHFHSSPMVLDRTVEGVKVLWMARMALLYVSILHDLSAHARRDEQNASSAGFR